MAFHYPGLGPPNYGRMPELYPVIADVLARSNVKAGEKVIIYTDTAKHKDIVDAFFAAAVALGAEVTIVLNTLRNDPDRRPMSLSVEAMKHAETVIDLASVAWIYTQPFSEILSGGTRILTSLGDVDTILKMRPNEDVARRARAGARIIQGGKEIVVRSGTGSHLTVRKDGRKAVCQEGLIEGPGSWDNLPAGQCACAPLEDKADGRLIVSSGDIILPLKRVVSEPIELTLEGGRIVHIEGGGEAALLRNWFEKWRDPNSYVIAHIGFGCDHRAELGSGQLMEWESFYGNVMIAFGNNSGVFLGGKTVAKSHIDIVFLNSDFAVDGQEILRAGAFVHPELA
jgi:2,5-dihydroxypyridine 5,6-dioxygenase